MKKLLQFFSRHVGKQQDPVEKTHEQFKTKGPVHILAVNGGTITIHPSSLLNSDPIGYHAGMPFETTLMADRPGAHISVDADCRIHGAYIHAWKSVTIGKGVVIAAGTHILDSHGHRGDIKFARYRKYFQDTPEPVHIGNYVWIGLNCIILKGVEIGECAIIAAGSVVKSTIPAFAVAEGNPARVIRQYSPAEALPEGCSLEDLKQEKGFFDYSI